MVSQRWMMKRWVSPVNLCWDIEIYGVKLHSIACYCFNNANATHVYILEGTG